MVECRPDPSRSE